MKRTGRELTLTNAIPDATPDTGTIALGGYRLTTIFEDDREGYAWRVKKMDRFGLPWYAIDSGFSLFTTRPTDFTTTAAFRVWAIGAAVFSNQMIATIVNDLTNQAEYNSIKDNHMAVSHLSLLYEDGRLPLYNITLEEFKISDREEIIYRIKEIGQSLNEVE